MHDRACECLLVKAWLCSGQPHLPAASWSVSASFRPLDVYIYVFGSKSCRNRLKRAAAVRLAAPNKAKLAFSTTLDAASTRRASRPRSAGRPLPRQSSAIRVAWLRRATTWLAPRRRASLPCSRLAALVANRSRPACSASPPVAIRRVSLAPHCPQPCVVLPGQKRASRHQVQPFWVLPAFLRMHSTPSAARPIRLDNVALQS